MTRPIALARGLPVGLLLAVTAALLAAALYALSPGRFNLGTPADTRFSFGFYNVEQFPGIDFRWSGPQARLLLHGAGSGPLLLSTRLSGDLLARQSDPTLHLERDGRVFGQFAVAEGWREYQILLPPGAAANAAGVAQPLNLVSATTRPGSHDLRDLGVAVDWVAVRPVAAPQRLGDALARAALLTWGLAALAGLFWRFDQALLPGRRRRAGWRVAGVVAVPALLLVGWAWSNPYMLAWALPPLPWTLGLLTLLLLAGALLERLAAAQPPRALLLWGGLAVLTLALLLLHRQFAVGAGIALALGGLLLCNALDRQPAPQWALPADPPGLTERRALLWLGVIVLVALGMRLYRLEDLPFGMWRDEARHGLVALDIAENPGYRPIYIAENRVNMPALGLYPFALALDLWGARLWTMRLVTGVAGALTVVPLYALVYRLFERRSLALLAAALLAVSSWHISISRFSFPTVFDPLLGLTGLWLLLAGLGPLARGAAPTDRPLRRLGACLLAGVCLGLAVQTYHTGRVVPVVAGVMALLLLLRAWRAWQAWLAAMVALGLGFGLVLLPLARYALDQPAAFNDRVGAVFLLNADALRGRAPLEALDDTLRRHLLMFHVEGDLNGRHHAPGWPMLDLATGLGFLVGCVALLRRWRDWRSLWLLAALAGGLLPSALAVDAPHAMRSFGAVAFACVIAALGWAAIGRWLVESGGPVAVGRRVAGGAGVALCALGLNAWLYFGVMPNDPEVWRSFYPIQTRLGVYLREMADTKGTAYLDQVYVPRGLLNDPVFAYLTHGIALQSYTPADLSRPAAPEALFVTPAPFIQREVQLLAAYLGPTPIPIVRGPAFPDGSAVTFEVYQHR